MQKRVRKNRKKKLLTILLAIVLFFACLAGGLQLGCVIAEKTWEHWRPAYEKEDITSLLTKTELTEADYALLYKQTGLTRLGIDDLLEQGDFARIINIQNFYFEKPKVTADGFAPFTYTEKIDRTATITMLKDGDIIVSARMRVSFMRFGHSSLVIDGENGVVLEAVSPGSVSELSGIAHYQNSANFMVLRPKLDEAKKAELVAYARENLVGVPYKITAGIFTKKYEPSKITASHCSHLVWYAYKKFGVDLDYTGGLVVTPRDMARSKNVEVVQVYGFNPQTLWN